MRYNVSGNKTPFKQVDFRPGSAPLRVVPLPPYFRKKKLSSPEPSV